MEVSLRISCKGIILDLIPNKILIYLKKWHYLNSLKKFGEKNEPDLKVVKHIVNRGDVVVDIGANVGGYTKVLSDLISNSGRVLSIEPIPETFTILSWLVKRMSLSNVELFNCAISDKNGISKMKIPKYDFGGFNFYQARIGDNDKRKEPFKCFTVKLKSLDNLMHDFKKNVSFIKCDVKGHELAVIQGATEIISKVKPIWLIEISSDPDERNSSAAQLFNIFQQKGYIIYWFDGNKLRKRLVGDKSVNYFFLTPTHLKQCKGVEII